MSPGEGSVAAARAALGAPFRLHGRDPATGLDCVGLAGLAIGADALPSGYALRSGDARRIGAAIASIGLAEAATPLPGDLLLLAPGPGQMHLAIASEDGIIHADAMLRRVVERPGPIPWPVIGRWRPARGD